MKSTVSLFFAALISVAISYQLSAQEGREAFREYQNNHPFATRKPMLKEDIKALPKEDRPDLAWELDFLNTMDPQTKRPMPERLWFILAQNSMPTAAPGQTGNNWVERGPDNVGGRTRALMWDPNDPAGKKVWAGGVTGGLWYNNDITSASSKWQAVNDFWKNIAVSAIAFDLVHPDTVYVGTGEGWGAGASLGAGVWRSFDGGATWSQLSSTITGTSEMFYVNDIIVRNESGKGVVYAAVSRMYYNGRFHGDQGLFRSTDQGGTWTQVIPSISGRPHAPADIEIATDNKLWVGTRNNSSNAGGGKIMSSSNGTTWTTEYTNSSARRVELACAEGNANVVYGLMEESGKLGEIVRTSNGGTTWLSSKTSALLSEPSDADLGIPNTDFTRGQAWFDLIAAVAPGSTDTLIIGGVDLFQSTDGGKTWTQISRWSRNANLNTLSVSDVHADQHAIVFKQGSTAEVIFGNDGGVYWSNAIHTAGTSTSAIKHRVNGYNVTQYYACAINPLSGKNQFLAGAQDNGTQRYKAAGVNSTQRVIGGDGAYCFVDQTDAKIQIGSYVYNNWYKSTDTGKTFTRIQNVNDGSFINPAAYDSQQDVLYSAKNNSSLNRITNISGTPSTGSITVAGKNARTSHISVSPHTTTSSTIFVGTSVGDIYKVTNANATPSTINIDASGTLPTGAISCIAIGASENELLVTFSNYGVNSVYYTSNGGTTWVSKEGNLPDMPVRWALFNPNDRKEVILATELGVYSTTDISVGSPTWSASNGGLANVRVDMLRTRSSDGEIIAATHGRGLFSGRFTTATPPPVADFSATPRTICAGDSIAFTDLSTGSPTSWTWTINGATPSAPTGQNPKVAFYTAGTHTVTLTATNSGGSDSETKTAYITVNARPTASLPPFSVACSNSPSFTLTSGTPAGGTYSGTGVSSGSFDPAVSGTGTFNIKYNVTNGFGCKDSATRSLTVVAAPNASLTLNRTTACLSEPTFTLSGGTPSGGSFSGTGVSGSSFNPATAGIGTHAIQYKYTDGNSCSDSISKNLVVSNSSSVSLPPIDPRCTSQPSFALPTGQPAGGTYAGTGVSGSNFAPATAGPGWHEVHYIVNTSCGTDTATEWVHVYSDLYGNSTAIDPECFGGQGRFVVQSSGGSGAHTLDVNSAGAVGMNNLKDYSWVASHGSSDDDQALGVATDSDGNVYVIGEYRDTTIVGLDTLISNGGRDVFIAKYDALGEAIWALSFGDNNDDRGNDIIVTPTGDIWATGFFEGNIQVGSFSRSSVANQDGFLIKLSSSGSPLVLESFFGNGQCHGVKLASDALGNIYATGRYTQIVSAPGSLHSMPSAGDRDVFVAKLNSSGIVQWFKSIGGTGRDQGVGIAVSRSGEVAVTGLYNGSVTFGSQSITSQGGDDIYVATFTASGVENWISTAGGTANDERGRGVSYYGDDLYVTGFFKGNAAFDAQTLSATAGRDVFVARYNENGFVDWAEKLGGANEENGAAIAFDVDGNLYVVGEFKQEITSALGTVNSIGAADAFVARFERDGNIVSLENEGTISKDGFTDVTVDGFGGLVFSGYFSRNLTLGSAQASAIGKTDAMVTKYITGYIDTTILLNKGGHVLKVSTASGCDITMNDTLTEPARLIQNIAAIDTLCSSDSDTSLSLGTPSGGTYSGIGILGTNVFSPSLAGVGVHTITYTYTKDGCTDQQTFDIVVRTVPNVSAGTDTIICYGDTAVLNGVSPVGGTWSNASLLEQPTNLITKAFPLSTTDFVLSASGSGGCVATDTMTVTVRSRFTTNASRDTTICDGDTIQISVSGGIRVQWESQLNMSDSTVSNPFVFPSVSQRFVAVVVDNIGCNVKDTIEVTVNPIPSLTLSADDTVCGTSTFVLSASGASSYAWSPSVGLSATSGSQVSGTTTQDRVYKVVGSNGMCSTEDSIAIYWYPNPTVNYVSNDTVCNGDTAMSLTNGMPKGGVYSGAFVINDTMFAASSAGLGSYPIIYSYTDSVGCSDTAHGMVIVEQAPFSAFSGLDSAYCFGDYGDTLNGTPAGGVFAGTGVQSAFFNPAVAGVGQHLVSYSVTDTRNCTGTNNKTVMVYPMPALDTISGPINVGSQQAYGYSVANSTGSTFQWSATGGTVIISSGSIATIDWGAGPNGTVKVVQRNKYGCIDSLEMEVNIALAGLSEMEQLHGVQLFPNPNDGQFSLRFKKNISSTLHLYLMDLSGRVVWEEWVEQANAGDQLDVELSNLSQGMYLMRARFIDTNVLPSNEKVLIR